MHTFLLKPVKPNPREDITFSLSLPKQEPFFFFSEAN